MTDALKRRLVAAAQRAAASAYAPYSKFRVGAAVLGDNGRMYSGANVENSSYGLTICAERAAVFATVAAGCRRIKAVAVFARPTQSKFVNRRSSIPSLTPPCGACLQVVNEFGPDAVILLSNGRRTDEHRLRDLLPLGFRLK
jgi:cytidine deaminase